MACVAVRKHFNSVNGSFPVQSSEPRVLDNVLSAPCSWLGIQSWLPSFMASLFHFYYYYFNSYLLYKQVSICVPMCVCAHVHTRMWSPEDKCMPLYLAFLHSGLDSGPLDSTASLLLTEPHPTSCLSMYQVHVTLSHSRPWVCNSLKTHHDEQWESGEEEAVA